MTPNQRKSSTIGERDTLAVTPHRLDGADREQTWQRIAVQTRLAEYRGGSACEHAVIRLSPRAQTETR